jgi:hypothetical protein
VASGSEDGFNYYRQYHPEEEVNAQWVRGGGAEAAGHHSLYDRLTFMGSRTTAIPGYEACGSYARGC